MLWIPGLEALYNNSKIYIKDIPHYMKQGNNNLKIGAARVKINIPDNFFPYRSFRRRVYTGQHDDIYARCIMLGNPETSALILSLELGDLGDIDMWLKKISQATGIPASNILITVTHTHEAPHVSSTIYQETGDPEKTRLFGECVWQATLEAIQTAKKNMRPGRISCGSGQCDINVNRDFKYKGSYLFGSDPHGLSDKTVAVLKFEDLNGEVIAYFINYAVHGMVMYESEMAGLEDKVMVVSGDIPGETSRYIEKRHDDKVVALWTSGAAGDQNPRYVMKRMTFDSHGNIRMVNVGVEGGYLLVQVQAENLADEVLRVTENMPKTSSKVVIKGIHKKVTLPGQKKLEEFGNLNGFKYEDANSVETHLSLLLINQIALVGIPGELVCKLGIWLKSVLPYREMVILTHCNGSISYISDDEGYEKRTFEATASYIKRGYAEKTLIKGIEDMIEELEVNI
jgi:neutral ceramidase